MVGLVSVFVTCFFDVIQLHPPPTWEQELVRLRLFGNIIKYGSLTLLSPDLYILVVSLLPFCTLLTMDKL